jgi:hypothetical protein
MISAATFNMEDFRQRIQKLRLELFPCVDGDFVYPRRIRRRPRSCSLHPLNLLLQKGDDEMPQGNQAPDSD